MTTNGRKTRFTIGRDAFESLETITEFVEFVICIHMDVLLDLLTN